MSKSPAGSKEVFSFGNFGGRWGANLKFSGYDEGRVVDKDEFEQSKSEYYHLRGWDSETGLPTKSKLSDLGLGDVADDPAVNPSE